MGFDFGIGLGDVGEFWGGGGVVLDGVIVRVGVVEGVMEVGE